MQTILLGFLTVAMVASPRRNTFIVSGKNSPGLQQVSPLGEASIYTEYSERDPLPAHARIFRAAEGLGLVSWER